MAKRKKRWEKREMRLPKNHGWRTTRPGNKIFVADRGAVAFEYPHDWIISPSESGSIRFFDAPEPDDNIRLEVSVIRMPRVEPSERELSILDKRPLSVEFRDEGGSERFDVSSRSELDELVNRKTYDMIHSREDAPDLPGMIEQSVLSDNARDVTHDGRFRQARRAGLELAWIEVDFTEATEDSPTPREAHSRICIARGKGIYTLITLDFWADDARKANRVWSGVLASLKLGEKYDDPNMLFVNN